MKVTPITPDYYPTKHDLYRIQAGLLIPGRGDPQHEISVVVEKGKITHVTPSYALPEHFEQIPTISVPYLLPGLWDVHVHYFGWTSYGIAAASSTPPALAGARCARDLAATLNSGITSVREVGGYGYELCRAVQEGWLPGPNIYSSVSLISMTAGHADLRTEPMDLIQHRMREGVPLYIADGVDGCIRAVREQVRRGAQLIKVATTGGGASEDDVQAQHFSNAELTAIVEEAERNGLAVAAHCHGSRGVMAAIRAGVHTIEHGSYLEPEAIEAMRGRECIFVATRSIFEWTIKHPEAWPPENYAKVVELEKASRRSYRAAIKAGVRIALGTDLGVSSGDVSFRHGTNATEFGYAVQEGDTIAGHRSRHGNSSRDIRS